MAHEAHTLRWPPEHPPRAVVLDSNIVLDLLVFTEPRVVPLRQLLAQQRLHWIATQAMRDELACVLRYPHLAARLHAGGQQAEQVLAQFDAQASLHPAPERAPYVCKDPDDQKFIDLAAAHAAVLLSKDKAVLCMRKRLERLHATAVAAIVLDSPLP